MGDTFECEACEHCRFNLDRQRAARTAYLLSLLNPYTGEFPVTTSDKPYSACFMSLAYYAGGIPMIKNPHGGSDGWFAKLRYNQVYAGNNTWKNHNLRPVITGSCIPPDGGHVSCRGDQIVGLRLIHLLSGAPGKTDSLPPDCAVGFHVPPEGLAGDTMVADPAPPLPGGLVVSRTAVLDAGATDVLLSSDAVLSTIRHRFGPGDYVFTKNNDGSDDDHGFMIVGFGPAIRYTQSELSLVTFDLPSASIRYGGTGELAVSYVPYVVDWHGNVDRKNNFNYQKPRPFYCSYWKNPDIWDRVRPRGQSDPRVRQINHNWWLFVRAPDTGWICCDWIHARHSLPGAPFYLYQNWSSERIILTEKHQPEDRGE